VRSYRHAPASESEGALMAKRTANARRLAKGKPKHHKHETNAERAAREDERRTSRLIAGALAMIICNKGRVPDAMEAAINRVKKFKGRVMATVDDVEDLLVKKPASKRLREAYTLLGRELCEFKGNVSEFLRLVADQMEGKRSYSPGEYWYDGAITRAYKDAYRLPFVRHWGAVLAGVHPAPSFSEFQKVFREQNPKLQGASERSQHRSLARPTPG
jgi:hypothetical protein